jgi:hypothetical protein
MVELTLLFLVALMIGTAAEAVQVLLQMELMELILADKVELEEQVVLEKLMQP